MKASNEIIVNTDGEHNNLFECKLVFVISGIDIKLHTDVYSLSIFRKLDRHGVIIGGINTGTYLYINNAGVIMEVEINGAGDNVIIINQSP